MKKFFLTFIILSVLGISTLQAQEMTKGMSLGNISLGLIPGIGLGGSYDYGLIDTWGPGIFTIGASIGFNNYSKNSEVRGTHWSFAPRATYRYAISRTFEVYGVAMIGAWFTTYSKYEGNDSSPFFGISAGCRYTFMDNLSLFGEIGYNVSFLNGGLSIAF